MEDPDPSATNPVPAPDEEHNSNSSSLTLSLTPPLSDAPRDETSTISEHLSSIENDRSLQEIEVTNLPENFSLLLQNLPEERISQEPKPPSLNSSFNSNSIISLNGLDKFISTNMEGRNNARSILEEILNNDQFKSGPESKEESLDIFANVDLEDKLLNSYNLGKSANFNLTSLRNDNSYDEVCKRVKDFEELIAVKDTTIAALTTELDSFRELMSNTSSNSLGTSTTEYKQYQEECHNKLVEYHNALTHKDEQIEKLTASLQQSILTREEMRQHFKNEIVQLQEQLEQTSTMLKEHKCGLKTDFDAACADLEAALNPSQKGLFADLKMALADHLQSKVEEKRRGLENEISNLKIKLDADKSEHDAEMARLRNLLSNVKHGSTEVLELKQELDAKHSKEMEELRCYFEKKCADLEKNYSEEIFSQQSRKMSGSSSCSDIELSSDFAFNQPGPGGDAKFEYTVKDVVKLHQTLTQIVAMMDGYDLNELTDEEFERLKSDIGRFDLRSLVKYDLSVVRNELQNKYHAELEILREDFDNRVDMINVENDNRLRSVETKYLEEIDDLNVQLRGRISTTVQEVANSGEFEIDEVVQSYERRLQEQVTLAKIDIIAALENQIQRLVSCETINEDWPEELLQLKARFSDKYQREIARLKADHADEIARLKEEHAKNLNGALERARRRSLRDADSLSKGELELLKERDALKKQTLSLRNLLGELLKYFTQCEDELNNTLVEELISKNLTRVDDEPDSLTNIKRVHITPNFHDLINLIDSSPENDLEAIDLKGELGLCLEKLKSDANAVLALTDAEKIKIPGSRTASLEKELSSLTRRLIGETQVKNGLVEQLSEAKSAIQSLEVDRGAIESQLEQVLERQKVVEDELARANGKIAELIENGHRETVSEGYGEDGRKSVKGMADAVAALVELQEKARNLIEKPGSLDQNLMHLIEDLARVAEKILEEARKEREDLNQQIEAADKKYKITCQFLEDQAAEREQERDEAQKQIDALKEHLKDRDKDRVSCERIANEVETLEQQLREMSRLTDVTEKRCKEAENERKEAVDKIFELRDIIRELEEQVKTRADSERELRVIVDELEAFVKHQASCGDDVERQAEAIRNVSDVEQLRRYIGDLEGEVQRLRLSTEIAGSEGAIQQIKNHLCEFETTLDKRTKDLETLHSTVSTTSCSSPSEDMSIRDMVHENLSTIYDECEVPLQQLARLKEKLVRHSRAEDAAVKRVRDLDMQISSLKSDLEESQTERDILKKQISDHLVLISNLQIRLDEQRIRAEHIEKQTNTSLEVQNYDLKNTIVSLEERVAKRDRTIAQLKVNIDETKRRLEDREKEISSNKEDEIVTQMQQQLELLRSENHKLKTKIDKEAQILPNLVENIISDKNSDIEMLREKLKETEKRLEAFASLNLAEDDIEVLNKLRLSGIGLEDLERVRRTSDRVDSLSPSRILLTRKDNNDTTEPEVSAIEKVGPPNLFYSLQAPLQKANSTEKHVRFEDEVEDNKITKLREEISEKNGMIEVYEERLRILGELETKVDQLQASLEETETNLRLATEAFELEQKKNEEELDGLRRGLAGLQRELSEKEAQLEGYRNELDEEKRRAVALEADLKNSHKIKIELKNSLKVKEQELRSHEETLKLQNEELQKYRELQTLNDQNLVELNAKEAKIAELTAQMEDLGKELVHHQVLVAEKEKIIDQMGADSRSLHINLETIQNKLKETGNVVDLTKRLREEQKNNALLREELHASQTLSANKKSLEDIQRHVQRELDYAAYLDSSLLDAVGDGPQIQDLVEAKELAERKYEELRARHDALVDELRSTQLEDAALIEQLRTRMDGALDHEAEVERSLDREKRDRADLERQLRSMSQQVQVMAARSQSLPDESAHQQEVAGLRRRIETLKGENDGLRVKLKALHRVRFANESDLQNERELTTLKDDEIRKLEEKLAQSEERNRKQLVRVKADVEVKAKELATSKSQIDQLESECKTMKKQMETLKQKLKPTTKKNETVPDKLMEKIRDLNTAVKDNLQMMDIISRLTREKSVLEERIRSLENHHRLKLPFDDPSARANYLFAKYLRSESYRKALTWQKSYLISLLETYQRVQIIPQLQTATRPPRRRSTTRKRFKHVALMVVCIYRMKFMVKRWHSGKRIVQQRIATSKAQFHVGQPVSSQNFVTSTVKRETKSALILPKSDMPWFGTSPPSREPPKPPGSQRRQRSGQSRPVQEALNSPGMLSKYIDRFNQIQERLGLDSH